MVNRNVRSYEVSIWTLQDSFITVLKPAQLENKGQIQNPKMDLKDDGTQEFSFSLPMYLYIDGVQRENPLWYNVRNGIIVADLRKIKVIFNKGLEEEGIFEFLITEVTERHESDQLFCDVKCEGLAFHELGKIGYKISLNEEDYFADWDAWAEDTSAADSEEPVCNLDYWMEGVLANNRKWTYTVTMDWSSFDGTILTKNPAGADDAFVSISNVAAETDQAIIVNYSDLNEQERVLANLSREAAGLRRYDKIYEEPYNASWEVNNDIITPTSVEEMREKYRLMNIEESNIYNITQSLAETFGVFCKYVYHYDSNYHIIGREIVFYNNFLQEQTGSIDLTYPYYTNDIKRTMDATDTVTKMYVKPLANDSSSTGYATITTVEANKSLEDYLLNFDYLYSIGSISEEQYAEVDPYQARIRELNLAMLPIEQQLIELRTQLPEKEAALTIAENSKALDKERLSAANELLNSILKTCDLNNGEAVPITVSISNPKIVYPVQVKVGGGYTLNVAGYNLISNTLVIYPPTTGSNPQIDTEHPLNGNEYEPVPDDDGNIVKIKLTTESPASRYYLTYQYVPDLEQRNVIKAYTARFNKDKADEAALEDEISTIKATIESLETSYKSYLEQKQTEIVAFENMMGPALREGTWQPEDEYAKYGDKYNETFTLSPTAAFNSNLASIGWDNTLFDNELKHSYQLGVQQETHYYPCLNLTAYLNDNDFLSHLDDLSFIFKDTQADVPTNTRYWSINSLCHFGFLRPTGGGNVIPVLILDGAVNQLTTSELENGLYKQNARLGVVSTDQQGQLHIDQIGSDIVAAQWLTASNYEVVEPRIQVTSLEFQTSEDQLSVSTLTEALRDYYDFSILIRDTNYYVTLMPDVVLSNWNGSYKFKYTISNTALAIYLDAIQVMKENAYPKVSYEITPSLANESFTHVAYTGLNKITHINDYKLKFENVLGYISELSLDLDRPEQDSITIKNYKNKFEDLFSTIVAETEEMKKNSTVIGMAASAFTAMGELTKASIQSVMDRVDLDYAFNQGTLTIDENNGIWGTSDPGVVAFRGGGIFTATEKDEDGDWIWNTGILPSGINASLITAGQLDTNLIRIFAGDNLKFQMNGDGLFAYKWENGSNTYDKQYVVHNEDGLFLVAKAGANLGGNTLNSDVTRVAISWDGLTMRNYNGDTVFYADADSGDLTLTGTVNATGLNIYNNTTEEFDTYFNVTNGLVQSSINSINIGVRNLLLDTGTAKTGEITGSTNQSRCPYYFSQYWFDTIKNGKKAIISFDWSTTATSGEWRCQLNNTPWTRFGDVITVSSSNQSGHFSATVNLTSAQDVTTYTGVTFRCDNMTGTFTISNLIMVFGNKAADWTPAPEDTNTAITALHSEITQTADSIRLEVSNLPIGGTNLLRGSGTEITNSTYNIARYYLTDNIPAGTQVTLRLWGTLGTGKTGFAAYNSGGYVGLADPLTDNGDGTFSRTFTWRTVSGDNVADNTMLYIYVKPNSVNVNSTITKIKLEYGNTATDWLPAPIDTNAELVSMQSELAVLPNEISAAVSGIKIGSANLFPASKTLPVGTTDAYWGQQDGYSWTYTATGANDVDKEFKRIDIKLDSGDLSWRCFWSPLMSLGNDWYGKQVTFSAYVYSPDWSAVTKGCSASLALTDSYSTSGTTTRQRWGDKQIVNADGTWGTGVTAGVAAPDSNWRRFSVTFTLNETGIPNTSSSPGTFSGMKYMKIMLWLVKYGEVRFYAPKLEWGNKATDWCDANGELYNSSIKINDEGIFMDTTGNFHVTGLGIGIDSAGGIFRLGPLDNPVLHFIGTSNTDFQFRVGPWNLTTNAFYKNNSTFGNATGLYFGVDGLSLSNVFKAHTTTTSNSVTFDYFTLANGTNNSKLFSIEQDPTDSSSYLLILGDVTIAQESVANFRDQLGIKNSEVYTATAQANLPSTAPKGAIGVVYTDVIQSSSITLSSTNVTDTNNSSSTDANINNANLSVAYPLKYTGGSGGGWQSTHNTNVSFHGKTPKWWNVCSTNASNDLVTGIKYRIPSGLGRVGSGATKADVSFLSSKVKVSNAVAKNNNITVEFTYIINPNSGAYSSKVYPTTNWTASTFDIDIYAENGTASLGHGTFTPTGTYANRVFNRVSANIILTSALSANTTYDVVFSCTPLANNLIFIVQRPLLLSSGSYTDGADGTNGQLSVITSTNNLGVILKGNTSTSTTPTATIYVMSQVTATTKDWILVATGTYS